MTRHFCDICGKELNRFSLPAKYSITITDNSQVQVDGFDNTTEYTEVCFSCISEINQLIQNKQTYAKVHHKL